MNMNGTYETNHRIAAIRDAVLAFENRTEIRKKKQMLAIM